MIFNGEGKILSVQDMGTWLVRQGKIIPALLERWTAELDWVGICCQLLRITMATRYSLK